MQSDGAIIQHQTRHLAQMSRSVIQYSCIKVLTVGGASKQNLLH